ncbi:MAG: acyl-CoA dehydrogenase family protein [Actinomycetota bacterium]|nr:acyl-CoA dehydrogenase family protein [Actinomycetota bacterium]
MTLTDTRPDAPAFAAPSSSGHWTGAPSDSPWLALARSLVPSLAARAAEHDREGSFVADGIDLLHDHRAMSMLVPRELGGGGATHAEACAFLAELALGCPNTSLTFSMHSHLVGAQVWRHHRELPAPVLPKVAADQLVLVSTGAADWMASSGHATKVAGGFRVSGRKAPSSGAPAGKVLVTSIRWDEAPDGPQVIHCSVPFSTEGVSVEETWDTMGMRGTGSHTVVLSDVFVPDAAVSLMRPADAWHPVWSVVIGTAMPLIMASYVGVAEAVAARAVALAAGRPDPTATASLIGRMQSRLTTARDVCRAMIDASANLTFDNTVEHAAGTLARKTAVAEAVLDTARLAMEVGGGQSFSTAGGVERLVRDAHGVMYHPLPAHQQELFCGRVALGLAPF